MFRVLSIFSILLSLSLNLDAQSFYAVKHDRSLILTAGTGTASYFGELTNDGKYFSAKPNLNVGLQYYLTKIISVRSEVNWFQLQGDDAQADSEGRKKRNLSFQSNNFEVNFTGHISFFPQGRRFYQRPVVNVYGFGGIGYMFFNPTTVYQGTRYSLRQYQTEGVAYSRFTPVIPFGLGMKFKVGPFLNLSFEGGFRKTYTDYLDDVSTVYQDPSIFSTLFTGEDAAIAAALANRSTPANLPGRIRGNPKSLDSYFLLNAKIEYYLPTDFIFGGNHGQKRIYKNKRKSYKKFNKKGKYKRPNMKSSSKRKKRR